MPGDIEESRPLISRAGETVTSTWDDFKLFISRGNVVDLAVGVIIGAAFGKIVASLVDDLFLPVISLILGQQLDMAFLILKPADLDSEICKSAEYRRACLQPTTPAEAAKVGAVTWNYGHFIQAIIDFLLIAFILFLVIKAYTSTTHKKAKSLKKVRDCPYCLEDISLKAKKCKFCGSTVEALSAQELAALHES